ncbi:hypothetical protein NDU88_004290 [Pleurodeles waltl]|uniref:Uncharacterized protein n=1 Tax=Pleurodeles waltl TaxID=8319 RepID=A0AAV7WTP4_PLEWA|nr:hypothetical protein NDU88_004290 [Pleurodeles waltl]
MTTKSRNRAKAQGWCRASDMAQMDMANPDPHSLQATLDKILGAKEESKTTLQWEIGQVSVELGLLRADHQKLADRVLGIETVLTDLAQAHQKIKATVPQLNDRVQRLECANHWLSRGS